MWVTEDGDGWKTLTPLESRELSLEGDVSPSPSNRMPSATLAEDELSARLTTPSRLKVKAQSQKKRSGIVIIEKCS